MSGWDEAPIPTWNKPAPKKAPGASDKGPVEETKEAPKRPLNEAYESCKLLIRAKEGLFYQNYDLKTLDPANLLHPNVQFAQFIDSGSSIAAVTSEGFLVINADKVTDRRQYDLPGILAWEMSPASNFVALLTKKDRDTHTLWVIDVRAMTKAYEADLPKFKKDSWPVLYFTSDDTLACKTNGKTVEVMSTSAKFAKVDEIAPSSIIDVLSVSRIPGSMYVFCGTVSEIQKKTLPKFSVYDLKNTKAPVFEGQLNLGHEMKVLWSPDGQEAIIWSQTLHDESGQSYYGEHSLTHFSLKTKTVKKVPKYDGPVHDVCWNPKGSEFITITGFMPGALILFDSKCTPKFEFGKLYFNTIKWSPLGRFILFAGFGALNGSIEIWDIMNYAKQGSCRAAASITSGWAPDGRKFYTAIVNPRLRVDNHYKIFKYTGEMLNYVDLKATELYEVSWRPGKYHDRPPSAGGKADATKAEAEKKPKRMLTNRGYDFIEAAKTETTNARFLNPAEKLGAPTQPAKPPGWVPGMATTVEPEKTKKKRVRKKKQAGQGGKDDEEDDDK